MDKKQTITYPASLPPSKPVQPRGKRRKIRRTGKTKSTDRENRQVLAALIIHFIGKIFATKR